MEKMYILAIDQGTTGCRAVLLNLAGEIVSSFYREIKQFYPQPGWVEHDAQEIWEATFTCIREVLSRTQAKPGEISCIGITNQRESTIVWEKSTGKPLYHEINWGCRRTASICERLKQAGLTDEVRQRTGLFVDPYFSATKIMWLRENIPGLRKKMEDGTVCVGTIDSWLIWNLTGGKSHVTDCSNASRTMLFNVKTRTWDELLLKETDIPLHVLPEVRQSSGLFGYTRKEVFFGEEIPITGVAGDQQSALFGQTCFKPGMAKNTYGTALAVISNIGDEFILSKNMLLTDLAWEVDGQVTFAFEGVAFTGASVVQWLRDGIKIIERSAESEQLAERVPDTKGVYLVPAFSGLAAPYWDPYARAAIVGITAGTTREHIARAALEAIAYRSRDMTEAMVSDSGKQITSLRVDGGATGNNFLMQFQADILGIPVERPAIIERTVLGAAYLAGLGMGIWKDKEEVAALWKIDRVFEPAMSEDRRETLYAVWKKAVERSFGWAKVLE